MRKIHLLFILLLGLFSYKNAFTAGFVYDDVITVVGNVYLGNLEYLGYLFKNHPGRALGYFTFFINEKIFGITPLPYHAVNVFLHLLTAVVLYFFTLLLQQAYFGSKTVSSARHWVALAVALLFVAHPIQTQAVTFVSQRFTILAALFYLLTLTFYLRSRMLLALLFSLLAYISKENSYTLPLAVAALELCFFTRRTHLRISVYRILPFFVAAGLVLSVTQFQHTITKGALVTTVFSAPRQRESISPLQYALTQVPVVSNYVKLLFVPFTQNADHDVPLVKSPMEARFFIGAVVMGILFFVTLAAFRRHRTISFGILLFFVALLVESSFVPIADVMVEHRVYLPSAGFFIATASFAYFVYERIRKKKNMRKIFTVIILVTLAELSWITYRRNYVWQTEYSLWTDAASKSPLKARTHYNLAVSSADLGKWEQAKTELLRTVELEPRYAKAYQNLVFIYQREGSYTQAARMQEVLDKIVLY